MSRVFSWQAERGQKFKSIAMMEWSQCRNSKSSQKWFFLICLLSEKTESNDFKKMCRSNWDRQYTKFSIHFFYIWCIQFFGLRNFTVNIWALLVRIFFLISQSQVQHIIYFPQPKRLPIPCPMPPSVFPTPWATPPTALPTALPTF